MVVVKVFGQLLPQHFISLALMTECYSAFKQPLLDVFGKITPKIDHRRTHDAGKPIIIPLVQDDGRFHLGDKIYCPRPVPSYQKSDPTLLLFGLLFASLIWASSCFANTVARIKPTTEHRPAARAPPAATPPPRRQ